MRQGKCGAGAWRALALIAIVSGLLAPPALAQVSCEEIGTPPGGTVTIQMQIDDPAPGATFEVTDECRLTVQISGTYSVESDFTTDHDFYLVFDQSGSTANLSGVDVDGNGSTTDLPADSIFNAEVTAGIRFVDALDPATSRVSVIGFSSTAATHQPLTSDLVQVRATLDRLLRQVPGGGTIYSAALDEVYLQATTLGDLANRAQRCLFLSDGEPNAPDIPNIHPAAQRLADIGVRTDTFALAVPTAAELEDIAATTGGEFHYLDTVGEILDVLPGVAGELDFDFTSTNRATGEAGTVVDDPTAGTFTVTIDLAPGPNTVELRIEVPSSPPTVLACSIDLVLRVTPGPPPIGPTLRVHRPTDADMLLHWESAPDLDVNQSDLVFASDRPDGGFAPLATGLLDRELLEPLPPGRLLFYDVRRSNCEYAISED